MFYTFMFINSSILLQDINAPRLLDVCYFHELQLMQNDAGNISIYWQESLLHFNPTEDKFFI